MKLTRLSIQRRKQLKQVVHSSSDADQVRRAEAILWLDKGESPTEIAARLSVSRKTIYNWVDQYSVRGCRSLEHRLTDKSRSGRPSQKQYAARKIALRILKHEPSHYGYPDFHWKTRRIREHVEKETGTEVSLDTIRLVLRKLPIPWGFKRPRYTLSRKSPTWKQEKGGSNTGFLAENEQ